MHLVRFILLAIFLAAAACEGQTVLYVQFPSTTDTNIDTFNNLEIGALTTNIVQRDKLLIFFPGTGAAPAVYKDILIAAATEGLYAIGLMYPNSTSVNQICSTSYDENCQQDVRMEIIDGIDRTPLVDVDRPNSIENRTTKLLKYLDSASGVAGNWGQFVDAQTNLVWSNIVVAGHSQGGGMAGLLAKQHEVYRCVMFASYDWRYDPTNFGPAAWITNASATPSERYFGFGHNDDPLALSNQLVAAWQAFGMDAYGPVVNIDSSAPPYEASHTFMTALQPQDPTNANAFHNITIVDNQTPFTNGVPAYEGLWKFMLDGPTFIPTAAVSIAESGQLKITFETRPEINYQVEASPDLSTYAATGTLVTGDGFVATSAVDAVTDPQYYRIKLLY